MKFLRLTLSTFLVVTNVYCFGQVKKASDFKNTEVLPTLEHTFNKDRNAVYSASFLYSIDKVKAKLKCPIKVDKEFKDLHLVLTSNSHQNTLRIDDFKSDVKISNNRISARASFQKSLPFEQKLFGGHGLQFNGVNVSSFELLGEPAKVLEILYFRDNNNFTLKLRPRDTEHEIILSMSDTIPQTLLALVAAVNSNIDVGSIEQKEESSKWKYSMTPYDIVLIPELAFNIEAEFVSIQGKNISCDRNSYRIERARQQTAFYLNERGAEIKSEGLTEVVFSEPVEDEEVTPKKMIFDKPFLIMLRKTNATHPYFCMWVANTEHMVFN